MSKILKIVFGLSLLVSAQNNAAAGKFMQFIKSPSIILGTLGSTGCFYVSNWIDTKMFEVNIEMSKEQTPDFITSEALKEYKSSLALEKFPLKDLEKTLNEQKHLSTTIETARTKVRERLKKNHNAIPDFISYTPKAAMGIINIKNKFGIIIGDEAGLGLKPNKKNSNKNQIDFVLGHEYSHYKNNDCANRNIAMSTLPLAISTGWRSARLSGRGKIVSCLTSLASMGLHSVACSQQSQFHESRADSQASSDPKIIAAGADWLESLQHLEEEKNILNKIFDTHPKISDRAKSLRTQAAQIRTEQEKNKPF